MNSEQKRMPAALHRATAGACLVLLALGGAAVTEAAKGKPERAERAQAENRGGGNPDQVCQGDQKIEGMGNQTYNPGSGIEITQVCIKAGQDRFYFDAGNPEDGFNCGEEPVTDGCYTVAWGEGCESVTISGGGTGRDCKEISHTTAVFGDIPDSPGSIIITKDAVPDPELEGITFTFTKPSGATEDLEDGESFTLSPLEPGDYTISELPADGWELESVDCGTEVEFVQNGNSITITLAEGQTAECTFVNTPEPVTI